MHLKLVIVALAFMAGSGALIPPVFAVTGEAIESSVSTDDTAWYRYNRITEDYQIQEDGVVRVSEPLTLLFNGSYHSLWRTLPASTSTVISDIEVWDGATGEPLTFIPEAQDATDPASWGRYTVSTKDGKTGVEWYFDTDDRVHTWVLRYTLRGAVHYGTDRDELNWDFFSGFDAPVDTVEATVSLPGSIEEPYARIFTTGGHDYYIDRPDDRTYRFRVSDIAPGERVGIEVSWQKGLVHPNVPFSWAFENPSLIRGWGVALSPLFGVVVLMWIAYRRKFLHPRLLYKALTSIPADVRLLQKGKV